MGKGKTPAELASDRRYVSGARVWLGLTKLKLEMALNHGRPVLIPDDETVQHGRRLLEHPLSIPTDSRCIAACELLFHRQLQIQPLSQPGYISPAEVDNLLESGNKTFDEWEDYWTEYYIRKGVSSTNFLVSERELGHLSANTSLRDQVPLDIAFQLSHPPWRALPK